MTTPHDLQSRLNAAADAKLEAYIERLFRPVKELRISKPSGYRKIGSSNESDYSSVMFAMQKLARDTLQESWRDKETKDFIERVNTLANSVEELREYVEQ